MNILEGQGAHPGDPIPWQIRAYPFDGKTKIDILSNEISTGLYFALPLEQGDVIAEVGICLTTDAHTKNTGDKINIGNKRTSYHFGKADFDLMARAKKVQKAALRRYPVQGYDLEILIDLSNFENAPGLEIRDDQLIASPSDCAFFQALTCVVGRKGRFYSARTDNEWEAVSGGRVKYQTQANTELLFRAFSPADLPSLAAAEGCTRTYVDGKGKIYLGQGHDMFLSRGRNTLAVSFSIDPVEFRRIRALQMTQNLPINLL